MRMKSDADGGSSSVLRSALCASAPAASASLMTTTRRRPSNGRYWRSIDDVAKLLDLDRPGLARLDDDDVGMNAARDTAARGALAACVALEFAGGSRLQAVDRLRDRDRRQSLADTAGPAMSTAGGIESRAMTRASSDNRRE